MKQSIKKQIRSAKNLGNLCRMQNSDLTQTTNFYIQDLFQTIFLTSIQPQITQECIKTHKEWIAWFS